MGGIVGAMATLPLPSVTEERPEPRPGYLLTTAREMTAAEIDEQRRLVLASFLPRGA